MKNANYENIVRLLIKNKDKDYISSEKIAYILNISKRTVLTHLNRLREESAGNGFQIVAKQGTGCRLTVTDRAAFNAWYRKLDAQEELSEVEKRRKAIFTKLISSGGYLNIYDLADEFYVSASLVRKDIKSLQSLAEEYRLTILHSHSQGYCIVGEERDIRRAIAKECGDCLDLISGINGGEHRTQVFEKLSSSVEKHLTERNITISQQSINSLSIHFLIALNRVETNNPISGESLQDADVNSAEYLAVKEIDRDLEKLFGLSLPEQEARYLTMHIKRKTASPLTRHDLAQAGDMEAVEFYGLFLRSIYKQSGIDFFEDDNLQLNLLNHISFFLYRLKNDEQISKSNLSSVKDEFPYANELAILGLRAIQEKYHKDVTEEETLYFAIHLALSLETQNALKGYNLAVLMDESATVFRLLSHKLKQALTVRINIIQLFSSHAAREELSQFDIILNATGEQLDLPQPTVPIETVVTDGDIALIAGIMDSLDEKGDINEVFSEDLYFVLDADSKTELLHTLIGRVSEKLNFNAESFYNSVIEREKFGSTAYSKRIAVPHPLEGDKYPHFIAVCRLNHPILWDGKHVELVFLVNCTQKTIQLLFKELSKTFLDSDKMYRLQKTATYEEFLDEFCK